MFHKPYRVKSQVQMKGSDKKKLRAELGRHFPRLTADDLAGLVPAKDEVTVSKIYTHAGDSLLVYTHARTPLFFEREKDRLMYPTVYALWRFPDLLRSFATFPPVVQKLAKGADLMLPGILVDFELGLKAYHDGKLKKGDALSVNTTENRAAYAVGTAALSSEDMFMSGRRGKGVNILHCYGDLLWSSGSQVTLPDLGPPDNLDFLNKTEENQYETDDDDDDDDRKEDDDDDNAKEPEQSENGGVEESQLSEQLEDLAVKKEEEVEPADDRSPQEIMDELLENAFLQAWKTSAKRPELPMLTSNFFRVHMVPQCPRHHSLDPKKSSHKKLSKFLAQMQKEKLVTLKELQKGVESIVAVDLKHPRILEHRVVRPKPSEADEAEAAAEEEVLPCDRAYEPPKITELFMVSAAVVPLFKSLGRSKGHGLTSQDVRHDLKAYVAQNGLQSQKDKGLVGLDPVLGQVVLGKGENGVTELRWDELTSRVLAKMSPGYALQFPGAPTASVHKGKLDPVELSTANRSGNKKVTLVQNLDVYRIDAHEFAHKCQVGVAASTSVQEAGAGKRPGTMQVLVQGNQVAYVSKLLMQEYGLPRKYIHGMEEATKKKKKGGGGGK